MFERSKSFINYYVDTIDPLLLQLQHATKSTLVIVICFVLLITFDLPQANWLILVGLFIMQSFLGDSLRYRITVLLAVSVITVLGVFVFTLIGFSIWAYTLGLAISAFIAFYLRKYGTGVAVAGSFILVLFLFSGAKPAGLEVAWQRVISSGISALVAIAVALLVWPYRPKKLLRKALDSNVEMLKEYIDGIFLDFLWGYDENLQANFYKGRVNARLKQARALAVLYPQKTLKRRLNEQLTLFGQAVALYNVFGNPSNSVLFFTLFNQIKTMRQLVREIFETRNSEACRTSILKLEKQLLELNQLAAKHEDIASLFFIVNEITKTFKRRNYE